ncbi:MAG: hypothetical protein KGM24_13700, partial [Elusimicrobia bacterium]|nr:hypothetical protein [Elusimicrobiota bacterium]
LAAPLAAPADAAAPVPAAAAVLPAPAAPVLPAAVPAAAAPEKDIRPAPARAEAPSASEQLSQAAVGPSDDLWDGGMPASSARKLLRSAHWETAKFFFTSRVKLLRGMIKDQETATAGKPRAVRGLEGLWLDWRVKAYSGRVTTAGFEVADRATIRREAEKVFARRFPRDAATRAAFRRYLDRVDAYVPAQRPSNYRKLAFSMPFDLGTAAPDEVVPRLDALLTGAHLAEIAAHRAERQAPVLASFQDAALRSIAEVNAGLPQGKKLVAVILLGSYAIGQSTPKSDIDYQLVTQDGGSQAIAPFSAALDRNWTENRLDKIEAFQFSLPPSRELVVESFQEGYRVISPDPKVVAALSKDSFEPAAPTAWSRLRGRAFGAFYRAWCWSYLRLAGAGDALRRLAR